MKSSFCLIVLFVSSILVAEAQKLVDLHLYSYNYALFNPAAAGAEEKHVFALNGRLRGYQHSDYYPYVYGIASYNGNIRSINSGVGITFISEDYGVHNFSHTSIKYNYKFKIKENASIRLGISPKFERTTIDFDKGRKYDPYGDLIWHGKLSESRADVDLGIWLNIGGVYTGITSTNLFRPKYYNEKRPFEEYRIQKDYYVTVGKKMKLPFLELDPSISFMDSSPHSFLLLNNNLVISKFFLVGGNYTFSLNSSRYYQWSLNTGVKIFDTIQVVGLIYSNNYYSSYIRRNSMFFEGMIKVKI